MEQEVGQRLISMELKYCEGCGGLLVRRAGEKDTYCNACEQKMRDLPMPKRLSGKARPAAQRKEPSGSVPPRIGPKRVEATEAEPRRFA